MTEKRAFLTASLITIIATLTLIFIGGLVRAEGAGLGCPDWPKCFGLWIPPTSVDQIPPQFFEHHPDIKPADFNAAQTYTEYVNRLVGVSIGFLILWTAWRGFKIRKLNKAAAICSAVAVLLVAYQGWLGGQVVKSRLTEWVVTSHMLLAILILCFLIAARVSAQDRTTSVMGQGSRIKSLATGSALLLASLAQALMGTRVRETVDYNNRINPGVARDQWVNNLGNIDLLHRNFAILVLGIAVLLLLVIIREKVVQPARTYGFWLIGIIALQMVLGATLVNFAFPSVAQMLHLTTGSATVCLAFFFVMHVARVPVTRAEGLAATHATELS
ncbi:MAG: COX15/CtaA family protein [Fimbriimonadales bacterium]